MQKLNQAWHLTCIISLGILGFAISNWPYTYIEAFRTESTSQPKIFSEDQLPGDAETTVMAGWPFKYLVKLDNANVPSFTTFSWLRLIGNIVCWTVLAGLVFHYERQLLLNRGSQVKSSGPQKHKPSARHLSVLDLLVATGVVAAAIAYWQSLKTTPSDEGPMLGEISQRNGRVVKSTWLPKPTVDLIKRMGIPLHEMAPISEVTLSDPTTELLQSVLELPYLRKLYVGGGQYDLRLLDRLSTKPLLTELRISGRELDPQAVAAIGQAKQLVLLNLMRTNVTEKAIQSFTLLSRLRGLNLIHTDVNFETLGTPACAAQLVQISVPRPTENRVVIANWPMLEQIVCNEFDQPLNDSAATIELSNLPRLKSVGLDCFQSVSLFLKDLPELHEVYPIQSQWSSRINDEQSVPASIWLQQLSISNAPKLNQLSVYAAELDQLHISEPMKLDLQLNNMKSSRDPNGKLTEQETSGNVNQWLKTFKAGHGPHRLHIDGISIEGVDISPLVSNERITSLGLSRTCISDSQIAQLPKMSNLEELDLTGNSVNGKSLELLAAKMPKLRKITCDRKHVERLRLEHHSTLSQLFPLTRERLPCDALRIVDMPSLRESFDLPKNLRLLQIDGASSLTGISLRNPWPKNSILRGVRDLEYFAAGGVEFDAKSFNELLNCKSLKHLALAYTKLPNDELVKIASLSELQSLTLSGSDVDDQLVDRLTQLVKLKSLRLDDTKVTDTAMNSIAKFSLLEQLSLHSTQVSGIGLRHLSSLPNLKQLHFGNNSMTAQEMQAIVGCKSLRILDLSGAQLDSVSLEPLVSNPPLSLELLGLRFAVVEGQSLARLVRNFPICKSLWTTPKWSLNYCRFWLDLATLFAQQWKSKGGNTSYESLLLQSDEKTFGSSGDIDPRVFAPNV